MVSRGGSLLLSIVFWRQEMFYMLPITYTIGLFTIHNNQSCFFKLITISVRKFSVCKIIHLKWDQLIWVSILFCRVHSEHKVTHPTKEWSHFSRRPRQQSLGGRTAGFAFIISILWDNYVWRAATLHSCIGRPRRSDYAGHSYWTLC